MTTLLSTGFSTSCLSLKTLILSRNPPIRPRPIVAWRILVSKLPDVRDNVLFGHAFDEERYWEVLRACALDQDTQQMHDSDLTHVGDRGSALSGGQQTRLALARAIYQVCYTEAGVIYVLLCQTSSTLS